MAASTVTRCIQKQLSLSKMRKSPGTNALGFEPVNHESSTGVSWAPSNPSTALLCVHRHRKTSTEDITHHLKITCTVAFFPISKINFLARCGGTDMN